MEIHGISKMQRREQYKFIDLFAGIGGIRMAFEHAGNKCVFTSEWDKDAQKTYSANWPGETIYGDITKVDPKTIPDFDILCGGFPCQPFSSIGKRQGFSHPTQGTLFFNVRNILAEKRPDAFLLENVAGLETHDNGRTISVILKCLRDELGYDTAYAVLDAADYGVPQHRRRTFFVGFKKELNAVFRFPEPTTAGRAVGIHPFIEWDADSPTISRHLQRSYIFKKDDGHPQIIRRDDPQTNIPVKTLCASYHKIQRITGTFIEGGPTGLRLLTETECKRIQGFPDNFKVPVCRTSMYHQFGNSVAVPVVEAIAVRLTAALRVARGNSAVKVAANVSSAKLKEGNRVEGRCRDVNVKTVVPMKPIPRQMLLAVEGDLASMSDRQKKLGLKGKKLSSGRTKANIVPRS